MTLLILAVDVLLNFADLFPEVFGEVDYFLSFNPGEKF
jgi:hypothetical protein